MQHFGDSTAHVDFQVDNVPDVIGSGDTTFIKHFLSKEDADDAFQRLSNGEIEYQQWFHMPQKKAGKMTLLPLSRLKIAMADPNGSKATGYPSGDQEINDKNEKWIPHYRFPVNHQQSHGVYPFSPTVKAIKDKLIKSTGIPFNHAVVLLYRDGNDCIGFHKDKTLDLSKTDPIASISLGQERTYLLRDSIHNPQKEQAFRLGHGDALLLGAKTNEEWYHSIPLEKENSNPRISLTFRVATTFRNVDTNELKGQGETYKSLDWPTEISGSHLIPE